ncbi:MAG: hypothetical protein UIM53_03920 [Acutalibacteraceae bacterium]|nr:hypothetical protein [Acutalibacteraceae bacterium]
MSTFTDWNGPQGGGVRAADLIQLANAYSDLVAKLNQHMSDKTPGTSDVHGIKAYVETQIETIKGLIPSVAAFITEVEADSKYALKSQVPTDTVSSSDLTNYAKVSDLTEYLKSSDLDSQKTITDIKADIAAIEDALNASSFEMPVLKAADHIEGLVHAVEQIQFVDKSITAFVGGVDEIGVYYILGMLKDKSGTAYIHMGNTKAFSAVVNFAITPEWHGALSVTTDCELKGLKWKIVSGTSATGEKHAYLAVQSTEWTSNFASSDGVGIFTGISFYASGINFVPVGSNDWVEPNGNCHNICDCKSGKGFSFSELATTILGKQIYREPANPYTTVKDLKAIDTIGVISDWPFYDANGVAVDVPESYHACDGTDVLPDDDVSDDFRAKFHKYPLQDYAIIKTKSTVEIEAIQEDVSYSLAEAVCTLHGIKFYTSYTELPAEAKINEPVIVAAGDNYTVYVYKGIDAGWIKYSTSFNDISSTIGAVAAVIAAVHGVDVYTVYNSVVDLPTGPSVEVGALAIVFDGNYSVFKYNGTAWELQV